MERWLNKILLGLSEDVLGELPDNCIDSIVTDPPYGLKFMGKKWDYDVPSVALWEEAYRVLKPGAHVLSFGGTRTYHRMVVNIEDAGFEIRDQILWIYGSGFPKSLNIGKAVDSLQGNERIVIDCRDVGHDITHNSYKDAKPERKIMDITKGNTAWEGWGTALKPAVEPICLARKPLEGTVANNVLKWGTGGMNIDECRVEGESTRRNNRAEMGYHGGNLAGEYQTGSDAGRFPANVIHDGSDEVLEHFPETSSGAKHGEASEGSAARFFYCAKASTSERGDENNHPTVKPLDLIKYLVKLITPPDGIVLDMFGGSGTTALACLDLGFPYIVIEKEPDYVFIANERIKQATRQARLFP
jgi:DNA modification methylase